MLNKLNSESVCICLMLTLPYASSIDVDLDIVSWMQGLMVVQDEHITAQCMYTC